MATELVQLGARVAKTDRERINALTEKLRQPRSEIVRRCIRLGMSEIEEKPQRFISERAAERPAP